MSLAHDLHIAHKERQARMAAAARRATVLLLPAPAKEPPKRRVTLPPALIQLLTSDQPIKLPRTPESVREILNTVAVVTKIPVPELLGQCRLKHLIIPRQVAIWAALVGIEGATPPWICPLFERDRATIHHAFQRVQADLICRERIEIIKAVEMRTGLPLLAIAQHISPTEPFGGRTGKKPDESNLVAGYGKRVMVPKVRAPVVIAPERVKKPAREQPGV